MYSSINKQINLNNNTVISYNINDKIKQKS